MGIHEEASQIVASLWLDTTLPQIERAIKQLQGNDHRVTKIEEEPVGHNFPAGTRHFFVTSEHRIASNGITCTHCYTVYTLNKTCVILTIYNVRITTDEEIIHHLLHDDTEQ